MCLSGYIDFINPAYGFSVVGLFSAVANRSHCQVWATSLFLGCLLPQYFINIFLLAVKTIRKERNMTLLPCIFVSYSEFDTAAHIVHVGDVYTSGHRKTQWVFVIDGSKSNVKVGNSISLLAICFYSRSTDYDLTPPINYNLAGSTVSNICYSLLWLWSVLVY